RPSALSRRRPRGARARSGRSPRSPGSSRPSWTAAAGCEMSMTKSIDTPVQVAAPRPPAPGRSPRLRDRGLALAFISPAMLLLLGMSVFPLLWGLYLSFTDYSATSSVPGSFVGLHNYADVLTSAEVRTRALTTTVFVAGAVLLQTVLGFAIAYLISRRTRGRGLLTTLFLVPMMLPPVVVGLFWRFMLDAQF